MSEHTPVSENPNPLPENEMGVYVFEVQFEDGSREYPVQVSTTEPNWREQLSDARRYLTSKHSGKATIVVLFSDDLLEAGAENVDQIAHWTDYRERILTYDEEGNIGGVLNNLKSANVPVIIIQAVEKNLEWENNEKLFRSLVEAQFEGQDKEDILNALEIAKEAHEGQFYAKPDEKEGLTDVPYVNHSIQVAIMALRAGLSPAGIQAALLHDVVEDVEEFDFEVLAQRGIAPEVIEMLKPLTKNEGESREVYLARSVASDIEPKIIKHLDRFDNVLRAFTRPKPDYHARYIAESRKDFYDAFFEIPELEPYSSAFDLMLDELEKYKVKLEKTA